MPLQLARRRARKHQLPPDGQRSRKARMFTSVLALLGTSIRDSLLKKLSVGQVDFTQSTRQPRPCREELEKKVASVCCLLVY